LVQLLEHGLSTAVNGNAQAFGFSITITVSFGIVDVTHPAPALWELVVFALAGVAAFAVLNLAVVLFLSDAAAQSSSPRAVLVGTATDFLAVGAAVGAAVGVSELLMDGLAWTFTPFAAGVAYVLVQSVEFAVGREETGDG
jgi:hypothetical protein